MDRRDRDRLDDLSNKLDKRFDDLEARQDRRFDELKAEMQEGRAQMRALREALLSIKASGHHENKKSSKTGWEPVPREGRFSLTTRL